MIVIATRFIPLSSLPVVSIMVMWETPPVAWKEYCSVYWLKELQESMDRCTGRHDITEITVDNGVKHHTINNFGSIKSPTLKGDKLVRVRNRFDIIIDDMLG